MWFGVLVSLLLQFRPSLLIGASNQWFHVNTSVNLPVQVGSGYVELTEVEVEYY